MSRDAVSCLAPSTRPSQTRTLVHLDVHGPPPDIVLARLLVDDALVLRAAARLLAREVDERARGGNDRALVPDGVLVEQGYRRIALDADAVHVEARVREVFQVAADDCRAMSGGCMMEGGKKDTHARCTDRSLASARSACAGCAG